LSMRVYFREGKKPRPTKATKQPCYQGPEKGRVHEHPDCAAAGG